MDGNAVAPATAREIGAIVERGGATFVDGGLIGPPPRAAGSTRLYLSGREAKRAVALFEGSALEAIAVNDVPGAASALKMVYAAFTKGTSALLMGVRALAASEGVDDALLAEWHRSQPDLPKKSEAAARDNARKAWRFVGEMEEIAATFEAAGLPGGFHQACGEIYRRLADFKDVTTPPAMADLVGPLTRPRPKSSRRNILLSVDPRRPYTPARIGETAGWPASLKGAHWLKQDWNPDRIGPRFSLCPTRARSERSSSGR